MLHPIAESILIYYRFYPIIYLIVCAYHVYSYYEYTKVLAHYFQLIRGKKDRDKPVEEDYEWIFIEEEILDDDEVYFDLHMMVLVTETEPMPTQIEGEGEISQTEIDFVEIPI